MVSKTPNSEMQVWILSCGREPGSRKQARFMLFVFRVGTPNAFSIHPPNTSTHPHTQPALSPNQAPREHALPLDEEKVSRFAVYPSPLPLGDSPAHSPHKRNCDPHRPAYVKGQLQTRWAPEKQTWEERSEEAKGQQQWVKLAVGTWEAEVPQRTWSSGPGPLFNKV